MAKAAKTKDAQIQINPISIGRITCHIMGVTPLIMHRLPMKAMTELLYPKGRLNAVEKGLNLKHDPIMEYRDSMYRNRDPNEPAAVHMPSGCFSKALGSAALDMPGATKAQILRLVSCSSSQINIFGVPQIYTTTVRMADIARTPDIRTRSIFPEWACAVSFDFVSMRIKSGQVANLVSASGMLAGIGDWRTEKSGGPHGKFRIVEADDPDYLRILQTGARDAQLHAIQHPQAYDATTEELLAWFKHEAAVRERVIPSMLSANGSWPQPEGQA